MEFGVPWRSCMCISNITGFWQLVLDGVVDMKVGYEANDSGSKHPSSVYLSYFILYSKVGLKLFFR